MVPEVGAAVSEKPTTRICLSVIGRTDAIAPEIPMPTQKSAQRLLMASSSVWPIYMSSPGHLKIAGVVGSHTHTQEHLQAIQELIDHILRF